MRILVCEYLAGGGLADQPLPADLLQEGRAMLAAVLADFARLGGHRIATILDSRLAADSAADETDAVRPGEFAAAYAERLRWADAVLLIAPETGGVLAGLTAAAEARGCLVLGSSAAAVAATADKLLTGRRLLAAGVPTPPCHAGAVADPSPPAWPYPLVLKPVDGCGATAVSVVCDAAGRARALRRLAAAGATTYVEQPYVAGTPASVSLLVARGRVLTLSLNRQLIDEADGALHYRGGEVPLPHPLTGPALAAARAACRLFPGLQGYVGVDLVLGEGSVWVIEVNPRITTAYIGLRQVCPFNLAEALLAAARHGQVPRPPGLRGSVRFAVHGMEVVPCSCSSA